MPCRRASTCLCIFPLLVSFYSLSPCEGFEQVSVPVTDKQIGPETSSSPHPRSSRGRPHWGRGFSAWACHGTLALLLTELPQGHPCLLPPSPGMTHEDIVQESKKYWQQMEAHAGKASSGLVRPSVDAGGGIRPHPFTWT